VNIMAQYHEDISFAFGQLPLSTTANDCSSIISFNLGIKSRKREKRKGGGT